ncbi:hypothetical protein [Haloarchaeobius sp. DFWS5]|uniref:hypothetical protein n=1 Tax=Haloarchaeobius sp. DFWS5 TaxID=3446114 RepID=UPI003EBAA6AC
MDGDDGGMGSGGLGSAHSVGNTDIDGDTEARMENADGDSGMSALQSMGYVDSDAGTERDATGSGHSTLQTVVILAVVGFFGLSVLYLIISTLLLTFGIHV